MYILKTLHEENVHGSRRVIVSESESESEVKRFLSFDFYETFICFRGVLNLNCYIGKKVQKNFLMGLKVW